MSETETRVPPTLVIQIWDNDKFSADDFIGICQMSSPSMRCNIHIYMYTTQRDSIVEVPVVCTIPKNKLGCLE